MCTSWNGENPLNQPEIGAPRVTVGARPTVAAVVNGLTEPAHFIWLEFDPPHPDNAARDFEDRPLSPIISCNLHPFKHFLQLRGPDE